jgi:hypothetical protein
MRMGIKQWLMGKPNPPPHPPPDPSPTPPAAPPAPQGPSAESLAVELVDRGRGTRTYDGGDSYYFVPTGEGVGPRQNWDPRAREIGEALYRMCDYRLELMHEAHARVVETLGPIAGRCLEANWDRIGEDQWAKGMGQIWRG